MKEDLQNSFEITLSNINFGIFISKKKFNLGIQQNSGKLTYTIY